MPLCAAHAGGAREVKALCTAAPADGAAPEASTKQRPAGVSPPAALLDLTVDASVLVVQATQGKQGLAALPGVLTQLAAGSFSASVTPVTAAITTATAVKVGAEAQNAGPGSPSLPAHPHAHSRVH